MKKILTSIFLAAVIASGVGAVSAATSKNDNKAFTSEYTTTAAVLQRRYRQRQVRYVTRNIRQGRYVYRVTYQVIQRPNGRTTVRIIRRVRIR